MALLDNELARAAGQTVEIRPAALRLRWRLTDLVTADSHRLVGTLSCSVRALPEPTERRMLTEVFLQTRSAVTIQDVVDHFAPAFAAAAGRVSSSRNVGDWLDEQAKPAMIEALRDAGKKVAFSCGLELLPPFHLDLDSPSFQQQKLEAMQRQLAEQRAASQAEQVKRALGLLKEFQTLQESAPELSPSRLLERLSPTDQGSVLQTLLLAAAHEQPQGDLWVVAGPYLVKVDAQSQPARTQLSPLPPTLGPLRSVQAALVEGQRRLLVGAQTGVMIVDPAAPDDAICYTDRGVTSPLGFSGAVAVPGWVWACHSDAGLVGWKLGDTAEAAVTVRPAQLTAFAAGRSANPRYLQALDDRELLFAMGARLMAVDLDGQVTPGVIGVEADIAAIVPESSAVWVVHEDGTVVQHERGTLSATDRQRRAGRLSAAGSLPFLGTRRLLLASDDGPVYCVGLDDPLMTQYVSAYRGLRAIAGSAQCVAGLSADRQRLILWRPWDARQPAGEVYILSLAHHRAADVDFG